MAADRYHKTRLANHVLHPETLMLGYGYDPLLSEGAVKPPVFLTSTFVFRSAEEGRDFFDYTAGRREPPQGEGGGLVYSRFNHPNSEIVEDDISRAFKRNAKLDAKDLSVETSDHTVTVSGTVRSWAEHDEAIDAAWAAPGVRDVKDRIAVLY